MLCFVDNPGQPALYLKGNARRMDLEERGSWNGAGRSGGMGNCSQNILYEGRSNLKYKITIFISKSIKYNFKNSDI